MQESALTLHQGIAGKFRSLSNLYFDPKPFESTKLYEKLGMKPFKKYLPTTGDLAVKHFWSRFGLSRWIKPNLESLRGMEFASRVYEGIHLPMIGFFAQQAIENGLAGDVSNTVYSSLGGILVGIYPLMLQRYNRIRLYHAIDRMESKTGVIPLS